LGVNNLHRGNRSCDHSEKCGIECEKQTHQMELSEQ
jgi:hypothetical protein